MQNGNGVRLQGDTVCILMATYNGERFLHEQLQSIAAQTYSNWFLVVSDDGSNDGTRKLIECFAEEHPNKVTVLPSTQPRMGACGNFFRLMRGAPRFETYMFCDQDDVWRDDKIAIELETMYRMRERYGDNVPLLAFCDARVVNTAGTILGESFCDYTGVSPNRTRLNEIVVQNPVSGAEVIANRRAVALASRIERTDDVDMHDQFIALVCSAMGHVDHIGLALYDYRQHESNEKGAVRYSMTQVPEKIRVAHASLTKKQRMAELIAREYEDVLSPDARDFLARFGAIRQESKARRILFLAKHHVAMAHTLSTLGLYCFI